MGLNIKDYRYIIAFDPSTQAIGVCFMTCFRTHGTKFYDLIIPRTNKISEKTGKELKADYYDKTKAIDGIIDLIDDLDIHLTKPSEVCIVLPDNGGNLNVKTIKQLERLNGLIEGIFSILAGSKLIMKYNNEKPKVIYVNEMKARASVLKNVEGENWKEKAMKHTGLSNHDKADARILLDYVLSEDFKE